MFQQKKSRTLSWRFRNKLYNYEHDLVSCSEKNFILLSKIMVNKYNGLLVLNNGSPKQIVTPF